MVNYWDLSSGTDENKVLILPTISKRIMKCVLIAAPTLLFSSIAMAAESPKVLTFEQCEELVRAAETLKVASKTGKMIENFRKVSGWGANFEVCRHAYLIAADGTKKAMSPKEAVAFALMFMLCGGFITMHGLGALEE
uniref:hypothetical protein n=1 Tax=Minidiscus spinulatus TaxID=2593073 RepID=UPI00223710E2|nr:hypothetical protein OOA01_pgp003 [Minidiscus spinulatus]UYC31378.1 hypothetical protein [Minidiscus spinulatus]